MLYHTFSTQEEIDQEYNPRFIVENTDELIQSYFTESQRVLREYSNRSVNIDEIVRQSRAAAAWTYRNAEDFGGNPERISVSGHSAGGHLTGMLMSTDWEKNYGLPPNLIKGFLPVSGLFDLKPFPFSWLQPKLLLTSEQVLRNSPVFLKPVYTPHVMVAVGSDESYEFQRQSKNYTIFLQKHGVPAEYLSMPGKNHFNIIHDFLGDGGPLCKKIIEWK